jgi:hypothetical protein
MLVAGLATMALAAAGGEARAATYHVSPRGDDAASGTSPRRAWRTLAHAGTRTFRPGDRLLLKGGAMLPGTLSLGPDDQGRPGAPVTVGSYGRGRATISASASGIVAYNTAGLVLRDLVVRGPGQTAGDGSGIEVYTDLPGGVLLPRIALRRIDVNGFGRFGVSIGSWNGRTGFSDVSVVGVRAWRNRRAGILTFAHERAVHRGVVVSHSRAWGNPGEPGLPGNSGNGIVLGGVDGGRISHSIAHGNGGEDTAVEGPVGIWAYDSNAVVIEHNESYANRTGGPADGGGFDLDQNTSNSVVQYNYSHDNDGAGFLVANGPNTAVHSGNSIRYNISQDDGRRNGYAGVFVWRRTADLQVHHNTVFLRPNTADPAVVRVSDVPAPLGGAAGIAFRNNLFLSSSGAKLVRFEDSASEAVRFEGNGYHAFGPFRLSWDRVVLGSLAEFRSATGQEVLQGTAVGLEADPRLVSPGSGGTIRDPRRLRSLSAYRLRRGSPAVDAGLALTAQSLGGRDFYGVAVRPGGRTLGAAEAPGRSARRGRRGR